VAATTSVMVETRSGEASPVRQEIVEVTVPELLVLRHEPMPQYGLHDPIETRVEFHAYDGGTRLELTGGPYTPEMGPHAEQGWAEQLDKLVRLLSA
jgi:hypothetical protein